MVIVHRRIVEGLVMCLVLMVQAQGIKPRDTLAGTSVRVASSSITPLFVAFAKLIHLNHVSGLTCRPVLVLRALHIDILDVGVSTYSTAPPSHLGGLACSTRGIVYTARAGSAARRALRKSSMWGITTG